MYAAVIGNSPINELLTTELIENGFEPYIIENVDGISSISGEPGSFTVNYAGNSVSTGFIIVTEGFSASNCFVDSINEQKTGSLPSVFVLDLPVESPAHVTEFALSEAARLARRKRKVFFLARFIRTAGENAEILYREAREAGVSFIRYEALSIKSDENDGTYIIDVSDGYGSYEIKAGMLAKARYGGSPASTERLMGKLHIKQAPNGAVNSGSGFLFPAGTSRKGIFFMDSGSVTGEKDIREMLAHIVKAAKAELSDINAPVDAGTGHAEVDPGKCAFCYTCYRACPHFAMTPDNEKSAMKNVKASCSACGICVSVCPADAARLVRESEIKEAGKTAGGLLAAYGIPYVSNAEGSLKIFCCENSGLIAFYRLKEEINDIYDRISIAPAACGGETDAGVIAAALKDYGKVLVVTCPDDACRHFEGNKRAQRAVERVRGMLRASGMDEGRVELLKASAAMKYVLRDQIREMI